MMGSRLDSCEHQDDDWSQSRSPTLRLLTFHSEVVDSSSHPLSQPLLLSPHSTLHLSSIELMNSYSSLCNTCRAGVLYFNDMRRGDACPSPLFSCTKFSREDHTSQLSSSSPPVLSSVCPIVRQFLSLFSYCISSLNQSPPVCESISSWLFMCQMGEDMDTSDGECSSWRRVQMIQHVSIWEEWNHPNITWHKLVRLFIYPVCERDDQMCCPHWVSSDRILRSKLRLFAGTNGWRWSPPEKLTDRCRNGSFQPFDVFQWLELITVDFVHQLTSLHPSEVI